MLSKKIILIILIITFILSIVLTMSISPQLFDNSKYYQLLKIFSSLAIVFISLGLLMTSDAIETGQDLTKIQQTFTEIDRSFMNPIHLMSKLYDKCPNFIRSLWPQKNIFNNQVSNSNKDDDMAILELSMTMLQGIEDHLLGRKFDLLNDLVWEANFLQWCNSVKFYEMWKILYPNFAALTNDYVEIVFNYSQGAEINNAGDLTKLSIAISNDIKIKDIINRAAIET